MAGELNPVSVAKPTEIHLIPLSELAPGQTGHIRNGIIRSLSVIVASTLRMSPDKLVVRDIRAKDDLVIYSVATDADIEDWAAKTGTTANVYETMATGTVGDQRWIAIYGVKDASESKCVSALKFNIGGGDRVIWQLQCLNEEDGYVGFSPSVIVMPQNTIYTISRFVRMANSGSCIVLKGLVIEPRGLVVSP